MDLSAVAASLNCSVMEHRPTMRALARSPQTLGESAGLAGELTAAFDPVARRWRVEWPSPQGGVIRAECAVGGRKWSKAISISGRARRAAAAFQSTGDFPPGTLACAQGEAGRVALRSGQRIAGVPPLFPSASLIFCRDEAGAWCDVAFADESPEVEIGSVALAVAPDGWLAAYLVSDGGRSVCRTVQLPREKTQPVAESWRKLPPYPHAPGMAGLMTAMHGDVLLAAGGANFPDLPPWEGGQKKFYDEIYALLPGAQSWIAAGRLPAPRAYGATVTTPGGVLIVGGEDGGQIFQDALLLRWDGERAAAVSDPRLPAPTTCAVATVLDGCVYVAGGYGAGAPRVSRNFFWRCKLGDTASRWEELPAWPGPTRALAVMAALGGAVYLISGIEVRAVDGKEDAPVYLKDAFRFQPGAGWEALPDLPWSAIAAASPAPVTENPPRVFVLGGVDGRQVGKIPRATQVPHDIVYFDVAKNAWRHWPERWPNSVVCTSAIERDGEWILPSGEIMAGKRTTEVWAWRIAG